MVVPSLAYGGGCTSTVSLQNTGDRALLAEVEGHRQSGALTPFSGGIGRTVQLDPGRGIDLKLGINTEERDAWVAIHSPAVAVSATTECISQNQLRTASRPLAFAIRNPTFSAEVDDERAAILFINASEFVAHASGCYSSGALYSVLGRPLQRVCDETIDLQVPPFGSRRIAVARNGSTHFSLKTIGERIVLELLRPVSEDLRLYHVDSSVKFGEEAPAKRQPTGGP